MGPTRSTEPPDDRRVHAEVSEGLSAAEVAKERQRHLTYNAPEGRHPGRFVPVVEALLLSVVTIVTAWAGFSAAKWSTESRLDFARASTLRLEANRALSTAFETRNFDSTTFNAWFTAYTLENDGKMKIAERRFRPAFRIAFDAWRATDPDHNPDAPPGPTYMREYKQPEQAVADRLDSRADAASRDGEHAGGVADSYVRITVLLAAVLFLIGIGTTFAMKKIRYGIAAVGSLLLLTALVLILQQPLPR